MLSRMVRAFNLGVGLLVMLIAFAVYWFAFRPMSSTSGELKAPVSAPASIRRDARGVPHIEATSLDDVFFLQGFATAQDRLWQMDTLRRFGAGELSEVFGAAAIGADERSRRFRMRAIAEAAAAVLPDRVRSAFVQYARGVNFYIETHSDDLPLEFRLPGHSYDPKPWTIIDTLLAGYVLFRDLTDSANYEFEKGQLLASTSPEQVRRLFPLVQGGAEQPGSNAWAIAGWRTQSGKPMLASDPHLAYGIPPTWHMARLKAPGLNVTGVALPGVPGIIIGHNEQIAWGVTNLQTDVLDLYAEQLNSATGEYLFRGETQHAQLDRQVIAVRGEAPREVHIWVTKHGPVLFSDGQRSYTVRWSAADGFEYPFIDIDRAGDWTQFRHALENFWGPGQNFVYADRAGNIGYQAAGRIPVRGDGHSTLFSDVPLDGVKGDAEWTGYVPFEKMPSIYNPPSGLIATANQRTFPDDFAVPVPGSYADRYRIEQIRARLDRPKKWAIEDMLRLQTDVYSAYDFFLAQKILAVTQKLHTPDAQEAAVVLRQWNGQMSRDEAAPFITQLLHQHMGRSLMDGLQKSPAKHEGTLVPRPQVIENLLKTRPSGFVRENDWDGWLIDCLNGALAEGRQREGSPISKWRWGGVMRWNIAHAIGKNLPLVSSFFDIGPIAMSGSGSTVKQTTLQVGPSQRMVVDWGRLESSVQNIVTGESGMVASPHYKDQWSAYDSGRSFPMQFERLDAKETLAVRPMAER